MANIKKHLDNIKGALFGKDVRSSIHDGIDAINKEVESTTNRQEHLEDTFDQLVINSGNSNAEIVDARVGENGKSYAKLGDRLDEVDSQLEHKTNFVNIKEFGAKCDGETDDTQAIINCLNYVISNKITKTILIPEGNTFLSGSIEKDCNGQSINIACVGDIKGTTENEVFYLYNFTNSNIQLNFKNGGNSSSYGLKVSKCSKSVLDIKGSGYKGTVLYIAGNKNQNMGVTSMLVDLNVTNACYRALQHGVDSDGAYQDAFGTYERIIDFDSKQGMLFVNSADITIQHIENHYIGDDYSVKFKNCGVVHGNIIAIGGKCSTLLELEKTSLTINKLYTCNEEYGEDTDDLVGVAMKNGSILNVVYYDLGMTKTFLNKADSPSLCIINTLKANRNDCNYITTGTSNTLNNSGIFSYNSYQLEQRTANIYKLPQRFDNSIEFYSTDTNVKRAYMSCYNTEWELNQVIPGGGRNKMMFFRATEASPYLNIPKLDVTGTLLLNSVQLRRAGSIGELSNPVSATTEEISNKLNLLIRYLKDAGLMDR